MRAIYHGWLIVWLALSVMLLVFGTRFSLGLFIPDLTNALQASLSSISLVFALSTLVAGASQPVTGWLADRYNPAAVIAAGLVAMGAAFIGTGIAHSLWQFALAMGVLSGLAFSATNLVILSTLVSRWFARKRGQALGIVTAGSKIGNLVIAPVAGAAIAMLGWRVSMILLGASMLMLAPLAWHTMRRPPEAFALPPDDEAPAHADAAAPRRTESAVANDTPPSLSGRHALATPAFWLISGSLFGNGFMMNLIYFHLPNYLIQQNYDTAFAAAIMALMGGIGIIGTVASGAWSDRIGQKAMLAVLYLSRAAATALILIVPSVWTIYVFAGIFGFLGYGAVALTSGITGHAFGVRSLGAVFGMMYVLHQIGGALGALAGGLSVDFTGSYTISLAGCAVLSVASAILVMLVPVRGGQALASRLVA